MTIPLQERTAHRWTHWPLDRLFRAITATVLVFLALVLALGVRQYMLYDQCRRTVAASDRLLFRFTAIRDHLNESLVMGEEIDLRACNDELQHLEKEAAALRGDLLVPEALRNLLPGRVDLVGLEVRLRAVQERRHEKTEETAAVVRSLDGTNIGLQQFRFLLGDHAQTMLLGLHRIIVGALGLIVALSCTLLYLLNRHLAAPVLALCRLTAPPGDDGDARDPHCSLAVLVARLRALPVASEPYRPAAEDDATAPEALHREALRYRHALTGCIGLELASELTNGINGVINYTQTLIDIAEQGGHRQETAGLYRALVREEKKTADLVAALQRVSQWQSARSAASIALPSLFQMVLLVLDKPLRAESVALGLPTDCRHDIPIPAGDLWLVLLTLLQQGRRALHRETTGARSEKWLNVACRVQPGADRRLQLVLTNSAAAWDDGSEPVWPSLTFCAHLMHRHQASLTVEPTLQGTHLLLDLPCRPIAA